MKYILVVGTRPEIIKMAPIAWSMDKIGLDYTVFFTGQHFSPNMGTDFFEEMGYDSKRVEGDWEVLKEMNWEPGEAFRSLDSDVLRDNKEYVILAEGDTTSVMLAAVVAVYRGFKFAHIEAGLRSGDHKMREERFRCAADQMSDYLFCPMDYQYDNVRDCIGKKFIVGNTIADVVKKYTSSEVTKEPEQVLITLHRNELLMNKAIFPKLLQSLAKSLKESNLRGIFPAHPHTAKLITDINFSHPSIQVIPPVPYAKNLALIATSNFVITDSGGIQEEACIVKTPCIIIRANTEREETIRLGAAIIRSPEEVANIGINFMPLLGEIKEWEQPYGDDVGNKIVKILLGEERNGKERN